MKPMQSPVGRFTFVLAWAFGLHHVSAEAPKPVNLMNDVQAVAKAGNEFAAELFARVRTADKKANLFFSPYSISVALQMTQAGAAGETETQMAKVLHFDTKDAKQLSAASALRTMLAPDGPAAGYQLKVANRIWGQQGFSFMPAFTESTRRDFDADLGLVDFAGQTEAARQTINTWVDQQTEHKIQDLLPAGSVDDTTRLVIANAIYFKGGWTDEFNPKNTKNAPFHLAGGTTIDVPTMVRFDVLRYADDDSTQVLKLPYGQSKDLAMMILLPKQNGGLDAMEAKLTGATLRQWSLDVRSTPVHVYLPKFKMTSSFELTPMLSSMGMSAAFDPDRADFSRMASEQKLCVSAVIHKAFVEVNEQGTEAAAATGVIMAPAAAAFPRPQEPVTFRADHPFVFTIVDNRSGSVLFLGRVANPKA